MAYIGKNIRKIRAFYKLSQTAFAEIFQQKRANIGAWEEERAEPNLNTIIQIANHFNISLDNILCKELTVNEIAHFDLSLIPYIGQQTLQHQTTSNLYNQAFPLVDVNFLLEFIHSNNEDFIKSLPKITIPLNFNTDIVFRYIENYYKLDLTLKEANKPENGDLLFCTRVKNIGEQLSGLYVQVTDSHFFITEETSEQRIPNEYSLWQVVAKLSPKIY